MSRAMVVGCMVFALANCGGSDTDTPAEVTVPDVSEIASAMSAQPAVAFSISIESGTAMVLSATGVLDVPDLRGHRADASGLAGDGLEPIAEVWLNESRLSESVDGMPAEPINGGLADFLGIDDPSMPTSLDDVITGWLESVGPQPPTTETIDGEVTTHLRIDRTDRTPLDAWIDSEQRIVRVVEVDDGPESLTATHVFEYPDSVIIPPTPEDSSG